MGRPGSEQRGDRTARGLAPSRRTLGKETSTVISLPREPLLQLPEFRSFRAILATVLQAASEYPNIRETLNNKTFPRH